MPFWKAMDTTARRIVGLGVLVCVLIVLALTLGWCNAREEAARAQGEGRVADAQAGLGSDAAEITAGQTQAEADNAAQTGRNREDILNAENANENAGAAGDAGLRALCQRVQYRGSQRCVELLGPNRPDASR